MDVAHLVWFPSRPHPFAVQAEPCLAQHGSSHEATLTLTEVRLQGTALPEPLVFQLRVDLRSFVEREPPPRSQEVEALAREFFVQFPYAQIEALVAQCQLQQEVQQRLASFVASTHPTELLSYAEVIREGGGLRQSPLHHSGFFFLHDGREFLIEDHYCANPACDCQAVSVEFWERRERFEPEHRIDVEQSLRARFSLEGHLQEIEFRLDSEASARQLLQAWQSGCDYQLQEFRKRYQQLKLIGERSFPALRASQPRERAGLSVLKPPKLSSSRRVGRNELCPCGSGLKYKRCCGQRVT